MPLRLPLSLHKELKAQAKKEGLSLNQYCLYVLARHQKDFSLANQHRAENLLIFLAQAEALQKQWSKTSPKKKSHSQDPVKEKPLSRLKKIYEKH